ncbi:hypothetical protein C8Q74DRAFT_807596 [Fomes fomentarius]|nr:hypothetical protein C8Q74DRAFT_807596 [Fomes fomentarius]
MIRAVASATFRELNWLVKPKLCSSRVRLHMKVQFMVGRHLASLLVSQGVLQSNEPRASQLSYSDVVVGYGRADHTHPLLVRSNGIRGGWRRTWFGRVHTAPAPPCTTLTRMRPYHVRPRLIYDIRRPAGAMRGRRWNLAEHICAQVSVSVIISRHSQRPLWPVEHDKRSALTTFEGESRSSRHDNLRRRNTCMYSRTSGANLAHSRRLAVLLSWRNATQI